MSIPRSPKFRAAERRLKEIEKSIGKPKAESRDADIYLPWESDDALPEPNSLPAASCDADEPELVVNLDR